MNLTLEGKLINKNSKKAEAQIGSSESGNPGKSSRIICASIFYISGGLIGAGTNTSGVTADRASGVTVDRASGVTSDRASGVTADKASGVTADRSSGVTADRSSSVTANR